MFTVCVKAKCESGLGFKLDSVTAARGKSMEFKCYFFISKFDLVKGKGARRMGERGVLGLVVFKINDSAVPPTANPSDVERAILRAWEHEKAVTLRFRDNEHFRWYTSLN